VKVILVKIFFKNTNLKRFSVVQNFSKALKIGFISFNLISLEKSCWRFEGFRLVLFKNHRKV